MWVYYAPEKKSDIIAELQSKSGIPLLKIYIDDNGYFSEPTLPFEAIFIAHPFETHWDIQIIIQYFKEHIEYQFEDNLHIQKNKFLQFLKDI